MMKKLIVCVAMVAMGSGVAMASGSLGVFGSYWNPKNFDDGFGLGGKLQLGSKALVTEVRGGFFQSLKSSDKGTDLDLEVNPFEFGLALRSGDKGWSPYLGAGVGYYLLNGNQKKGDQFQVDDVVGWYAVGGFEYPMGQNSAIHFEGMYRDVTGTAKNDSVTAINKDDVSIDLSGVVFSVGLVIRY